MKKRTKLFIVILVSTIFTLPLFAQKNPEKYSIVNNNGFSIGYGSIDTTKSFLISAYDKLDLTYSLKEGTALKLSFTFMLGKEISPITPFYSFPEFLSYSLGFGCIYKLQPLDLSADLGLSVLKFISSKESYEIMPYIALSPVFTVPIEGIMKIQYGFSLNCSFNANIIMINTAAFISLGLSL